MEGTNITSEYEGGYGINGGIILKETVGDSFWMCPKY